MHVCTSAFRTRSARRRLAFAAAVAAPVLVGAFLPITPAMGVNHHTLIDFAEDTPVSLESIVISKDHPGVSFCSLKNKGVDIVDFTPETDGQGVFGRSGLAMVFDQPIDSLEATFGNDQSYGGWITTTGEAILTLYSGTTEVAQQRVTVNADDIGNQAIAQQAGGPTFNRATLRYEDVNSVWAVNLEMAADNIYVGPAISGAQNPPTQCPDPEPGTDPKGVCTVTGTAGDDQLHGTPGDDVICGYAGDDVIVGLAGSDTVYAGHGRDVVRGGSGPDVVYGRRGADMIHGGYGSDELHGNRGDDVLQGDEGDDMLFGDKGQDTGFGGGGADVARSVETLKGARLLDGSDH